MTETLLFTEDEWNAAAPQVVHAMTQHLRPYRAAVYEHKRDDEDEFGEGWGSGSFIRLGDRVFILTNEHIATVRNTGRVLAYQFDGQEDIRLVLGDQIQYPWALDLAVVPVDGNAWKRTTHQSKAITTGQIALAHDPVLGELLSFTGFAGETVSFHYRTLLAQGTCSTAREVELPEDDERFSSRFHFGIDYRPDLANNVIDRRGLPSPPGFSGSTVWDTGFVAAKMAGRPWSPDMARVTGVIWGWPSGNACLVATRAEYVRSFLLSVDEALTQRPTGVP